VLAITDHDTLSGWSEALRAAQPHPLEIVPGVELSTVYNDRSLHILGFYPDAEKLNPPLRDRIEGRKRRARAMADKLAALGYPIQLPPLGDGMAPGRPHIAKALLEAGYISSMQEAFERWLRDSGPAYVGYEKFAATEGIRLLRDCDAIPVWAHPYLFRGGEVEEIVPELVEAGLMGIEVYHPSHSPTQVANLERLCREYGLLKTGGSDYHGPDPGIRGKEDTRLNQLHLPWELFPPLIELKARLRQNPKVHQR
ncbi:MAG: PHP domain-containing protein, partial [Cyanobacteriota bacterium]|nr:PHP domain-containing protein [Cyanobacteriota bacterium]